jgi:predicted TIM-barrel fold metal-dependent hydrolase
MLNHLVSRRSMIGYLGALTATTGFGTSANAQPAKPLRIDTHHHIVPPKWLAAKRDEINAANANKQVILDWTVARDIEELDRRGISTAITSISTPGVWFGDVAEGRRIARECNEFGAGMVRSYPGRIGMFAAVPLPDIEGSLAEIAYAYDTLKLDGIGLLTSYGDRWPGDPVFAPVFEELNRRKSVVFFHPTTAACCGHVVGDLPPSIVEFGFNTTRAIESLLFSGSLTRYPAIRFIFAHGGGTVPFLADRMGSTSYARRPEVASTLPDGVGPVLRKLYFDIVSVTNTPAMDALRALMPPSQIVFGTDYPFVPPEQTIKQLDNLGLSADVVGAIGGNAAALFPRYRT